MCQRKPGVRAAVDELVPEVRLSRGPFWRYLLRWNRPLSR